jgi:hypothetical protein
MEAGSQDASNGRFIFFNYSNSFMHFHQNRYPNDWYATTVEILDINLPDDQGVDSMSILSLLKGSTKPVRNRVVHHIKMGNLVSGKATKQHENGSPTNHPRCCSAQMNRKITVDHRGHTQPFSLPG